MSARRADVAAHLGTRRVPPGAVDDALLVLSELVTNAVRHGRPPGHRSPVGVEVRVAPNAVRVEVSDSSATPPAPITAAEEDEGHRGLLLVRRLAVRRGVRPHAAVGNAAGKTVWALVAAPWRPPPAAPPTTRGGGPGRRTRPPRRPARTARSGRSR